MYINQILYFLRLFKNIRKRLEDMGRFVGSSEEDDDDDDDDNDHDHDNDNDNDNDDNDDDEIQKVS